MKLLKHIDVTAYRIHIGTVQFIDVYNIYSYTETGVNF